MTPERKAELNKKYDDILAKYKANPPPEIKPMPLPYLPGVHELAPELMFMHEVVFADGEEVANIDGPDNGQPGDWWLDSEMEDIRGKHKPPDSRVDEYLRDSTDETRRTNLNRWPTYAE